MELGRPALRTTSGNTSFEIYLFIYLLSVPSKEGEGGRDILLGIRRYKSSFSYPCLDLFVEDKVGGERYPRDKFRSRHI